ncbi:MAG TPA: hypothetical protein VKF59_12320 [Candidatus Dormibacteraeota bacterium]|nr:hypothetical protein [Candidatus Dormibacteraeota bacterium]
MSAMLLVAFLHVVTSDPWELVALIGPFSVVFGAGIILVILPIVRAGGERYENREFRGDKEASRNGNGSGPGHHGGAHAEMDADEAAAPTRRKG